ncbi:Kelch repeat and BTB domain-containing protein 1 [Colletotrichum fructicola]|uniref:Kelch repeat and BTB domain-containing protein 1 n=1 Tax=Colletotrichum fructicola (strain Nara gc5) TaxID=1213859 RepID=A0A7J6IVR2_COLFN|nr:Kelch repeat and BTB domain-containing protein 1 [Colletotrichum fructicola]KAF4481168.1 Kelch repeat and BTB domain-containing protein 1 [Colletotrichum fructicola Nara gc5]KAF4901098.1 Kelch repeat and BTB domain-containing protein 1 [Colletotrichum fructicola]KAF4911558.1 Kelch repeat and BTB domain-containing protein 1 [Colletotrichum fructicola]KAF4939237.1 Kelch repeat and BTB domain-containing protein 1 [Colletotrichum fructicola]
MSTEDHRWVFETGDFADFRIVCTDDGVEFNVHRLMLSLHSTYFARLFKSEFQETKLGISNLADVDSQTMGHLLDFFYRGNTPWKCPDDMLMLAKLWILADRLQATSAMIEVEHRVKSKLNGLSNKFIVADCTLLDTVFHHKACAESGLGYAVGEAACAILIDRSQYPKKSDLVEKHARENILSANMMLFWASRYKENSDEFEFTYRSSTVMKQRIDREEEFRDKLISEKMTKPSRILTSGPDATTSKKRKQSS